MASESGKAFEEVLPPFASTSASSSNPSKKKKRAPCDVFINHRGPDSKHTLAASIYETLKPMGVEVFLDEPELHLGDSIPSEIQDAMTTSFLHIAILSPRYAQSPWCLAELSFMLKTGNTIIPVFYNVDIGDIRWGKGIYTDAFIKLEASGRYSSQKLQDWRTTLQQVTYLKGHVVKEFDNEGKEVLLKAIEDYVKKYSPKIPLVVANYSVGLDEIVQDFEKYAFDSSENVKIVGIVGMGGCGKTTLAKEYYNKKRYSIYKCSFIPNVKDVSQKDLHKMQKKMLEDLGFHEVTKVDNIESGKAIIAEYLRFVQVFIILDDVDHQNQLECLLPIKDSLGHSSIVIVTSRDSSILTSWGISCIYKMKKLNPKYAMNLFCCHAFLQASLIDEFESRVQKFLEVCQGLPLSLKVLGGLVRGKTQDYWDDQLRVVSRLLPKDIKSTLKVSFDALDEEEKEIFLDICSFFIGEEKQLAVTVWDGSGWNGLYSFTILESKCLVEVDGENRITMHDHLRDLGRETVLRKEIAKSPCRVWSPQQIDDIELDGQESVLIRGLRGTAAIPDDYSEDFSEECMELLELLTKSRRRFEWRRLQILIIKNNYFTEELAELSTGLVWLRWMDFPNNVIPPWLSLNKLRVLELWRAPNLKELWSETAYPPVQLRELYISFSSGLRFPRSIGRLQHLKKISMSYTYSSALPEEICLPEEFCLLQSLEHLTINRFDMMLRSLPKRFGDLRNLRHLDLSCCGLIMLPPTFKQLINPQYINFKACNRLRFPPDIFENMRKLETLILWGCDQMKEFPQLVTSQGSLKKLDLGQTSFNMGLPDSIGQLSKLEELMIENSLLKSLPQTLVQLTNLQSLNIEWCPLTELTILSGSFSSSLCSLKRISLVGSSIKSLSISQQCCPSLEYLDVSYNDQLEEIDSLPKSVKSIKVERCPKVKKISPNIVLPNLESLVIKECWQGLDELPNFAESVSLQEFDIRRCGQQLKKIQGLENCRSLKTVIAETCWEEPGIQSLENTESLRRVELLAWNVSAFETSLQAIKKKSWAAELVICARTAPGVEEVVKSFQTFPGLTLVDSEVRAESFYRYESFIALKCGQRRSSTEATMFCCVINSFSNETYLTFRSDTERMYVERGKWVWIGVFTKSLPLVRSEDNFVLRKRTRDKLLDSFIYDEDMGKPMDWDMGMEVDKDMGMSVIGEKDRVMEAFDQLLQHLQNLASNP